MEKGLTGTGEVVSAEEKQWCSLCLEHELFAYVGYEL